MINDPSTIVNMKGISKDFPGVRALDEVDFAVLGGEIHGLVGENGAGKSTLIKILAGIYHMDQGAIFIRGERYRDLTPKRVESLGIQFIHQERNLVPHFTVAQSVFLGHEHCFRHTPFLNQRLMRERAEKFIEENLGICLDGKILIRDLSVAQAQIIQVARALMANPSIMVLDEPTAPLARQEVDRLFSILKRLRSQGMTIIYISHYLQEISEICDRVTILRNGSRVSTLVLKETNPDEIAAQMVGRALRELFPARSTPLAEVLLKVSDISLHGHFEDISFDIHKGEVVGLTGLLGSGRDAVVRTLYGIEKQDVGEITFASQSVERWNPARAVKGGVALVPRDRRKEGLVMNLSVADNINLSSLDQIAKMSFINYKLACERAVQMIEGLGIKTPGPQEVVRCLSGGNQQKVVLARWLASGAKLYLLNEPSVGIDVGAKVEIYTLINQLVANGAGVLLITSDIPELLGMCDRILIMFRGRIVKEFRACETTADEILSWATGGRTANETDGRIGEY